MLRPASILRPSGSVDGCSAVAAGSQSRDDDCRGRMKTSQVSTAALARLSRVWAHPETTFGTVQVARPGGSRASSAARAAASRRAFASRTDATVDEGFPGRSA